MTNATAVESSLATKQIEVLKWCMMHDPFFYCKGSLYKKELEAKAKEALGYAFSY